MATKSVPDTPYYRYKFTKISYKIAHSNLFGGFITVVIILNTIVLALDRY